MATAKQIAAARKNIKKAQKAWKEMSPRQHALAQRGGRKRKKPGTTGEGEFYRIEVRPKEEFVTFRNQDVGEPGGIERLAGKRQSGSWDTVTWLVDKKFAHVEGDKLVPDHKDAKALFENLGSTPKHIKGDVFKAKDRPNVPEKDKPSAAQKRARTTNIKKAQAALGTAHDNENQEVDMQVKEIMTLEPASCTPETPLQKVAQLMIDNDCGEIPVVDNSDSCIPVGVVTDRDIVCRTVAKGLNPLEMIAGECMTTPIISVPVNADLNECYKIMEDNQIRRVPVVDNGKCIGIVSLAVVAQRVSRADSGEILQEVSVASRSASNVI